MFDDKDILDIYQEGGREEYAFNLLVRKYSERLYWHIRQLVLPFASKRYCIYALLCKHQQRG
jgi:hypothetical protein